MKGLVWRGLGRSKLVTLVLGSAALAGGALMLRPVIGAGDDPKPSNPFAGLSRDERIAAERAVEKELAAKQPAFLEEFIRSGADIHSLPTANISGLAVTSQSLEDAVDDATLVVRGTVVAQRIDGPGGRVVSEVRVDESILGNAPGTVLVSQAGGPQLNGNSPVLVQLADDPLVRKGREYILLLGPCDGAVGPGELCTTGGGKQFEIQSGSVAAVDQRGWALSKSGLGAGEFIGQIRAAGAARGP